MAHINPKNHLQEVCFCFKLPLPVYTTKKLAQRQWKCTVTIGKKYALTKEHTGKKVDAEKKAARFVLSDMFHTAFSDSDSDSDSDIHR